MIGAGGHWCPVARAFGGVSEREEVVVAQESETRLSSEQVEALGDHWHAPELYVEPDLTGYGWYFPKGDVLNVGDRLRRRAQRGLAPAAERAPRRAASLGPSPPEIRLEPFRGHAYVVRRRPRGASRATASASSVTLRAWRETGAVRASAPPSEAASSPRPPSRRTFGVDCR